MAWTTYQSFSTNASSTRSAPATRPSVLASGAFENDIGAIIADPAADTVLDGSRSPGGDLVRSAAVIISCLAGIGDRFPQPLEGLGREPLDPDDGGGLAGHRRAFGARIEPVADLDEAALLGDPPQGAPNGIIAAKRLEIPAQEDIAL